MTRSPALTLIPRDAGALTGEILADGADCSMDNAPAVNELQRVLRLADFFAYRCGGARPVSLGSGCNVIPFARPEIPVSNVIQFASRQKTDPTPPTNGAPAARAA